MPPFFFRLACLAICASSAITSLAQGKAPLPAQQFESMGTGEADFDWVRQRYEHDAGSRAGWARLLSEARSIARDRTAAAMAEVRRHKLVAKPPTYENCYGHERCSWILYTERVAKGLDDWQAFSKAWTEARPVVAVLSSMVAQAEKRVRDALPENGIEQEVHVRFTRDQLLRAVYSDDTIPLSSSGRQLFQLVVGRLIARADRENTAWLRTVIETSGWPRPAQLSRESEMAAWFMLVHARDEPAFRLQALQMMREMVLSHEMGGAQYATRLDHILFEITGLQRYGTQGACDSGRFVPHPSEAPERLPDLRREMSLPSLEEQDRIMAPACAADPTLGQVAT